MIAALRILALTGVVAAMAWAWHTGHLRALASLLGDQAQPVPVVTEAVDAGPAPAAPAPIRRWTDEQGVVHFEQAWTAPAGASTHAPGKGGTMADYERELLAREGISIEDIARAKAAREAAATNDQVVPGGDDPMGVAVRQARELMVRYEQSLADIRAENNE